MAYNSLTRPKPWYRKAKGWVLLTFLVLTLAVIFGLQPLVRYETRKILNSNPEYVGDFEDAHLSLIPLVFRLTHLKLSRENAGPSEPPLVYVRGVEAGLNWHKLLKRQVVASASIDGAKLTLIEQPKTKEPAKKAISFADSMTKLIPLDVDRIEVKDSEMLYVLGMDKHSPRIWIHGVDATVENISTRANLSEGTTTLAMSGSLQRSVQISVFVTADPLEKALTFSGQAALKGLRVEDLHGLVESKADLKLSEGTIDVLAKFDARGGKITGGVQPVLKNIKVEATQSNLLTQAKAFLIDTGLKLFSDRVPGRNAVTTVIPIQGDLTGPKFQLWPTILGVIRNAFVEGIGEGFAHLPPPKSNKKEGALKQVVDALNKDKGIPKAQPGASK